MIQKEVALWYHTFGYPYSGSEPAFYNPQNFDWATHVMNHWQEIRQELSVIIDGDKNNLLKPYFDNDTQDPPQNWKTESFYFWSRANRPMIKLFPQTHAIISQIPGLVSASVNLLEPESQILPHYGDTNAIYRCHLGLNVPVGLPLCGFTVKGETQEWGNGKFLIFLDAFTHQAFNRSTQKRYILLLDVLRPEFRSRKYEVCSRVLGTTLIYELASKIPGLRNRVEKLSPPIVSVAIFFAQLYVRLFLFLQRNIFSTHLL